ncbi:STAS domain-containing protein [Alkalithermobacter paradoxus]|uniref:Anti-sigma factor antagonist n=1 Tax=Alkalithermobacter paradoxus TaxID=29349 RepID=A0A1V4I777_9FIRM|nr:anti-sigma-B factor antagonist [[Clostridium] thermoalcaliphilum]
MSLIINKSFDNNNNVWNVSLIGEVDIYTSSEFKSSLIEMIQDKQVDIRIDASSLDYIDSTGLGILIGILKRLKEEEKDIYIISPKKNIEKLLSITGLDKIFRLEG